MAMAIVRWKAGLLAVQPHQHGSSSAISRETDGQKANPKCTEIVSKPRGNEATFVSRSAAASSSTTRYTAQSADSSQPPSVNSKRRRCGEPGLTNGTDRVPDPPNENDEGIRFACPFRKHDQPKYNVRDYPYCASRSWDITRLK